MKNTLSLYVTFSDGSNPWVSLPTDRHTVAKHWRRWMKYHPDTAFPYAWCKGWICEARPGGGFLVYQNNNRWRTLNYYKHLGHALRALERFGEG